MPQNIDRDDDPRPAQLDALTPEVVPPPALEERVVAALRSEGLLGSRRGAPGFTFRRAAMAAGLVLVSAMGFAGGRMTAPATEPPGPDYILLLRSGPGPQEPIPHDEIMRRVREYTDWYVENLQRGVMIAGEKLTDENPLVLTPEGAVRRPDSSAHLSGDTGSLPGDASGPAGDVTDRAGDAPRLAGKAASSPSDAAGLADHATSLPGNAPGLSGEPAALPGDARSLSGESSAVGEPGYVEGYFLIRAPGDEAAERIASGCPHLKYGGVIEVRRIEKLEEEGS